MKLGVFSVSLAVKDIAASRNFSTKMGFTVTGGDEKTCAILVQDPP
jgi:predicted lactoylglutathione lyase